MDNPLELLSPQLTLSLRLNDKTSFESFHPGNNDQLLCFLKATAAQTGEKTIFLCGSTDTGKSHLLHACCHLAQSQNVTSSYIPLKYHTKFTPEIFLGLENLGLVCIDDIHHIAGNAAWEEGLFHLYNRIQQTTAHLVMSCTPPPAEIGIKLPDLKSRLSQCLIMQTCELSEEDKMLALQTQAKERGLILNDEVTRFLLTRCTRTMSTLFTVLDRLDKASWVTHRRLTIPFVKEVLQL